MQRQTDSDSQESVQFGDVDPATQQLHVNEDSDIRLSSTEQGTSHVNQRTPFVVNYGPCVMCRTNERCVLFIGCNHLACCSQCSILCNNRCPVPDCNQPIGECLRVFKS